MNSKHLDYSEAAKLIGVPVGTLYSWVSRKEIPHRRFGPRLVRFKKQELPKWIDERTVQPKRRENE